MPCGRTTPLDAAQAATTAQHRRAAFGDPPARDRRRSPALGWKTAHQILLREGWRLNHKRTPSGLAPGGPQAAREDPQAPKVGQGSEATVARATHAGHVCAIDFMFDETSDRRRLKLCNIVDEYTREALAIRVDRTCNAEDLLGVIQDLMLTRGAPEYLRADNSPEMIAWTLRDYCRLTGTKTAYIEPGSPWENPFVESFNGPLRDELLNIEELGSLTEAKLIIEDWRIEYNTYRPHSVHIQHWAGSHPPNKRTPLPTTNNQTTHRSRPTHKIPVNVSRHTSAQR